MSRTSLQPGILPAQPLSRWAKDWVKEWLCSRLHVPFNRHGVPVSLMRHLPQDKPLTLIDVGAFVGTFTATLAQRFEIEQGVLVEAIPERAAKLAEAFRPPQFQVVHCVVADRPGPVQFEVNEHEYTSSLLPMLRDLPQVSDTTWKCERREMLTCQARTLDEIAASAGLKDVDLLKLDIQGAEQLALRGAPTLLRRTSFVWTEVSFQPLYRDSCTLESLQVWLRQEFGFKMIDLELATKSDSGELLQADALFARSC
jgi:FkbM family methyltransferase